MTVTRRALMALAFAALTAGATACSDSTDDQATDQSSSSTTTVAASAVAASPPAPKVQRAAAWEAAYLTALARYSGGVSPVNGAISF